MENQLNQTSMPPMQEPMPEPTQGEGSKASLVAVIIALIVIVVGAIFFWGERSRVENVNENTGLESINAQGASDDTASIEADLNATDIENVDYDLSEENYTAS